MRRIRISKGAVILAAATLFLVGGIVWQEKAQARQVRLNHALLDALGANGPTPVDDEEAAEVHRLLEQGADPNARMQPAVPPLTIWQGIENSFRRLFGKHQAARPEMHMTALVLAAAGHNPEEVKDLLDHGAVVDTRSEHQIPCDYDYESSPCVHELLASQTDPLLAEKSMAGKLGKTSGTTALAVAAGDAQDAASVRLLLDKGADVNAEDEDGDTPLLDAAAAYGISSTDTPDQPTPKTDTLKLLLDHGANVNARDRWGRTALMLAAAAYSTAATKMLLARGADPRAKDVAGQTAFARVDGTDWHAEINLLKRYRTAMSFRPRAR